MGGHAAEPSQFKPMGRCNRRSRGVLPMPTAIGLMVIALAAATGLAQSNRANGDRAADGSVAATTKQQADADADSAASVSEMQKTLDRLNETIESERAALEKSKQRWQNQREQTRERRDKLAKQVLEAESERQRAEQRATTLKQKLSTARQNADRLVEAAKRLLTNAGQLAEQLAVQLRQVPAAQPSRNRIAEAVEALPKDAKQIEQLPAEPEGLNTLLSLVDQTHRRATRLHLRQTKVWTAEGKHKTADLLSAGHVGFAYRTHDEGQVAIALASPTKASGYRWQEAMPRAAEQAIHQTIKQIKQQQSAGDKDTAGVKANAEGGAGSAYAMMPVDVTQRLTAEAVDGDDGWLASLRQGGVIMWPLIAVAGFGVLLVLERAVSLYLTNGHNARRTRQVLAAARDGQYDMALSRLGQARGTVARTLKACLERRAGGQHAMEDAIQEQLLHETPRLHCGLGGIAILAAIAPLLGLLGTVTGIIETFGVIRAFGQTDPGLMAGGISEALVTTASGLVIAIPLLLAHAVLRGRGDRIIAEAEKHAATLLNVLAHQPGQAGETNDQAVASRESS